MQCGQTYEMCRAKEHVEQNDPELHVDKENALGGMERYGLLK